MLFSITAGIELSAYAAISGDYEYEILDDGTVEITEYSGFAKNLAIPGTIAGKTVSSIGDLAFSGCESNKCNNSRQRYKHWRWYFLFIVKAKEYYG